MRSFALHQRSQTKIRGGLRRSACEAFAKEVQKDLKKKEERDLSKKMAGRTYKKLVRVCEDIIYARSGSGLGLIAGRRPGMENVDNLVEKKSEVDLIAGKREAGEANGQADVAKRKAERPA